MNVTSIIHNTAYFLALINPASKIFILTTHQPPYSYRELRIVSIRSTIVAFLILGLLAGIGNYLLLEIFHVGIYSLKLAGGIILFLVGLTAVRQGRFYEESALESIPDISIVPLAAPLIAGPGTITAAISFSSMYGISETWLCISLALFINLLIMLISKHIGTALEKFNATGPLIRITGLIVSAVAVQMILSGFHEWIKEIK